MSNESMHEYAENTLSAFTNKLARGIQIDENWVVGLSAISIPTIEKFQRMEMAREIEGASIDDEIETFTPITVNEPPPKKKRRRREYRKLKQQVGKRIAIHVSPTEYIILTEKDIEAITYGNSPNLNCGILLQTLSEKIEPKIDETDDKKRLQREILKRNIKLELFLAISNNSWNIAETPVKFRRNTDEYLVHVYQGSKKSNNIVLKYGTYSSLVQFIAFLLGQLPIECRSKEKLSPLLNMFYESYNLLNKKQEIVKPKNKVTLLLPFVEYGASTGFDTEALMQDNPDIITEGVSLDKVIELFRDNLTYTEDRQLSANEKFALRTMIKEKIIDALRLEKSMDIPYASQDIKNRKDVVLNMPIQKIKDGYKTHKVVLGAQEWKSANALLDSVIAQIPMKKRYREVFIHALEESFIKAMKTKKKAGEASSMATQTLQSLPFDSADPTNPKAPDIAFPQNVDTMQRQATPSASATPTPSLPAAPTPSPPATPTPSLPVAPAQSSSNTPTPAAASQTDTTVDKATSTDQYDDIVGIRKDPHKNRFLYVYSDVIQCRIFGESQVRCMRVIPLTDASTRDIQFKHIEYIPVQKTFIDNISIMLCNSYGDKIQFKSSIIPTYCMLHFKRAR